MHGMICFRGCLPPTHASLVSLPLSPARPAAALLLPSRPAPPRRRQPAGGAAVGCCMRWATAQGTWLLPAGAPPNILPLRSLFGGLPGSSPHRRPAPPPLPRPNAQMVEVLAAAGYRPTVYPQVPASRAGRLRPLGAWVPPEHSLKLSLRGSRRRSFHAVLRCTGAATASKFLRLPPTACRRPSCTAAGSTCRAGCRRRLTPRRTSHRHLTWKG